MIYTDAEGIINVVYGNGSIVGMQGQSLDGSYNNSPTYSLVPVDPKPVGEICTTVKANVPDTEFGASIRFIFTKKESLDILIEDLQTIRKRIWGE